MNTQLDELTKSLAQSVTRRAALKKFGLGLASLALAYFGLPNKAEATNCVGSWGPCTKNSQCCSRYCRPDNTCGCLSGSDCDKREGGTCIDGYCFKSV